MSGLLAGVGQPQQPDTMPQDAGDQRNAIVVR